MALSAKRIGWVGLIAILLVTTRSQVATTQTPASTLDRQQFAASTTPGAWLEGAWVRRDIEGAGNFGGLGRAIPAAELRPDAAGAMRGGGGRGGGGRGGAGRGAPTQDTGPHAVGDPYIVVQQPCGAAGGRGGGALLINPDSGGVHFVVSPAEIIFAGERGGVRHIYMDGRPHRTPLIPTGAGHSVGHWEG